MVGAARRRYVARRRQLPVHSLLQGRPSGGPSRVGGDPTTSSPRLSSPLDAVESAGMGDGFTAMLDVLREQRARRALWAEAWPLAVSAALKMTTDRVDRNALFLALNATAGAWRAAYEGTPATAGERAVTRLAEAVLPVAEAVTDGQRAALAQRLHDGERTTRRSPRRSAATARRSARR